MSYAKLDGYNYTIESNPNKDGTKAIVIPMDTESDVDIADISTEINANDGKIYVDGIYGKLEMMSVSRHMDTGEVALFIFIKEE